MRSIRNRLFLILFAATGLLWLTAVVWIQHSTRAEVEHVLDRRLQESARMVGSLIARQGGLSPDAADAANAITAPPGSSDTGPLLLSHQLICQIWGFDGALKSASSGSPKHRLAGSESGFSETTIISEGETEVWRVYTLVDTELGIRVMVGDARSMREGLVRGVILGLLAPALLILPATALMIWWAVGRGLHPLAALARRLKHRPATDLSPLADLHAPSELKPMLAALNGLFARVAGQRDREQGFTAFAAHELKTPLAGIKTQAQIATLAPDDATRSHALGQIKRGVDRTDRLVRQLLDMAATDDLSAAQSHAPVAGQRLLEEILQDLRPFAQAHGVSLSLAAASTGWSTGAAGLLAPALRNLLENAVLASPQGAVVIASLQRDGQIARFEILDRGPGIAAADRQRITERFYRGSRPSGQNGSGLGLAIAAAAVSRLGGQLRLLPRPGGGEQAVVELPVPPGSPD